MFLFQLFCLLGLFCYEKSSLPRKLHEAKYKEEMEEFRKLWDQYK